MQDSLQRAWVLDNQQIESSTGNDCESRFQHSCVHAKSCRKYDIRHGLIRISQVAEGE